MTRELSREKRNCTLWMLYAYLVGVVAGTLITLMWLK